MQEKHPSYKESVIRQRVPLFTGQIVRKGTLSGTWYVVRPFVSELNLTAD